MAPVSRNSNERGKIIRIRSPVAKFFPRLLDPRSLISADASDIEKQEGERLRQMIIEQEWQAQIRYEKARSERKKIAAVHAENNEELRKARYEIGYHVDTWPPTAISSRLFVRVLPNIIDEDRVILTTEQIEKFLNRKRFATDDGDDSIVIVAESDEAIRRLRRTMLQRNRKVVTVTDFHLRLHCQQWVEEQIRKFNSKECGIFICTIDLEDYNMIPYAKFTIFNKCVEESLLSGFCTRQSKRSRLKMRTSIIDLTLSFYDSPRVVANVVELMFMREEYPNEDMMQFFENHCWRFQPSERRIHDQWRARETLYVKKETAALLEKIGPKKDKWWENPEILANVQKHILPTKEIKCHFREPTKRFPRVCLRKCKYYCAWRDERRRLGLPRCLEPAPIVIVPEPVQEVQIPQTPPGSPPPEGGLFRQLQDGPSLHNIPIRRIR